MNSNRFLQFTIAMLIPVASVYVLYVARSLWPPVVCGLMFAYILFPVVRKTDVLGLPRWLMILGIMVAMAGVSATVVFTFLPAVKKEISAALHAGDEYATDRQSRLLSVAATVSEKLHAIGLIAAPISEVDASDRLNAAVDEQFGSQMFRHLTGVARSTSQFLMIFVFVFVFGLLDGEKFYRAVISLIPNSFFEPGIFIFHKSSEMMGHYIRGLVVENVVLGGIAVVMTLVVSLMSPLSVAMALAISLIIALTNVIRIVGPIFGGAACVLMALVATADLWTAGAICVVTVLVQVADNVIVLPLVMQDKVDIHPVICLLAVLAGGLVAGVLGMLLAIPVVGGIKVVHRVMTIEMKQVASVVG